MLPYMPSLQAALTVLRSVCVLTEPILAGHPRLLRHREVQEAGWQARDPESNLAIPWLEKPETLACFCLKNLKLRDLAD